MTPPDELTNPEYWSDRQRGMDRTFGFLTDDRQAEWLEPALQALLPYTGGRFLELGCSPGHASALVRSRIRLVMEGVDTSPMAHLYLANLATVGDPEARIHAQDLRTFSPAEPYDVVASFGLIEHFLDTEEILDHHLRLTAPGGLVLVVLPSFRGIQWLFHALFDAEDLRNHHLPAMDPHRLRAWAVSRGLADVRCRPCGRMRFWWTWTASRPFRMRCASWAAWILPFLARRLPPHRWTSPWLILTARRSL